MRVGSPALVLTALAAGCAPPAPAIAIDDAYAYAPPTAAEAAAYVTIRNRGDDDTLIAVSSPSASTVTIHRQVAAGAMVRMEPVWMLGVPAGATMRLVPGDLHLMLEGLSTTPGPGDSVSLLFTFRRAGTVRVTAPVIAYGDTPPTGGP